MDKVEYKIRADEIKALIGEGRFAEAVKIADTIDWKRVKSVTMLCTISDLYKINRRFQESKDILLMAYDRHPTGRAIVFSLCELAIKMGETVQALEYYKEFVRIAPRDTGRYILQYKLYEAQEVSLEERIAVLEEFKKHDYRERWAYELAYLYHRVGLTTECVEECDEIFLWFGEGRYVIKALELKALHEPLSPEQQDRYIRYKQSHGGIVDKSIVSEKDEVGKDLTRTVEIKQPTKELPQLSDDVMRINDQETRIADPVNELGETKEFTPGDLASLHVAQHPETAENKEEQAPERDPDEIVYPHISEIKEPSVDVSTYNTMNLQESLAESLREVIGDGSASYQSEETAPSDESTSVSMVQTDTEEIFDEPEDEVQDTAYGQAQTYEEELSDDAADALPLEDSSYSDSAQYGDSYDGETEAVSEEPEAADDSITSEIPLAGMQEVFFDTKPQMGIEIKYGGNGPILGEEKIVRPDNELPIMADMQSEVIPEAPEPEPNPVVQPFKRFEYEQNPLEDEVPGAVIHPNASYQMHSHFDSMLSQDYDGQISLAVEPEPEVEKQITGQISIAEYLENWEQYKKEQQQKQLERVRQRVADETGDMFSDFDEKTKAGLHEKIEKAISDAIKKESYAKASGRGNWSIRKEDVINQAVDEVISRDTAEMNEVAQALNADEQETASDLGDMIESPVTDEEALQETGSFEPVAEYEKEEPEPSEDVDEENTDEAAQETLSGETGSFAPVETGEEEGEPSEDAAGSENAEQTDADPVESPAQEEEESPEEEAETDKDVKPEDSAVVAASTAKKRHVGNRELEERVRTMTPEEKELFGPYIHHRKSRRQIINAIDNLSMDAFSGNAIVTGEEGAGTVNLARGLIKAMQVTDHNFNGKVAKITANTLNKKSPAAIFEKLADGALIVQRAADLEDDTVSELIKVLQSYTKGLVLVIEDTREDMDRFLEKNPSLKQCFNVRVDIEALDDDSLVAYARQYALEREYAIDNLGILALHTRISERQTLDHDVTVAEVKDIVDDAIYYAEKRTIGHFVDLIVHKRFDENDMIILRENDFMH